MNLPYHPFSWDLSPLVIFFYLVGKFCNREGRYLITPVSFCTTFPACGYADGLGILTLLFHLHGRGGGGHKVVASCRTVYRGCSHWTDYLETNIVFHNIPLPGVLCGGLYLPRIPDYIVVGFFVSLQM